MFDQNLIIGLVVLAAVVLVVYAFAPRLRSMMSGTEGFQTKSGMDNKVSPFVGGSKNNEETAGGISEVNKHVAPFANKSEKSSDYARFDSDETLAAVPMQGAARPQGCYPREQLNPAELLPKDMNSQWAQTNPTGTGDIQGKNFLSAGALIGIDTVGQSLRNANLQLRAEPPNPQTFPGPFNIPTIQPDLQRRPLE